MTAGADPGPSSKPDRAADSGMGRNAERTGNASDVDKRDVPGTAGGPTRRARQKKARPPMPAGREARPVRQPRPDVHLAELDAGSAIVRASFAGTGVLGITAIAADLAPHPFEVPALVVALALFFGGTGAFVWAYFIAIGRSRVDDISLLGVYGLAGSTPAPIRLRLFCSLGIEVAIAVVTASARLYSTLSFGILALMWGLGLAGLWGARHGAFPPRPPTPADRGRSGRGGGQSHHR